MTRFCHRRGTILLLTLLLLSSCTQEDGLPGDNVVGSRPALLGVNTLQAAGIEASRIVSRAIATPDYPTSKSVGFFVKADATNGYKAVDNRKGVYSSARKLWLPEAATPGDSIWLNSHDADVAIYAPHDAAQTTASTLNLAACLRPTDGSKDIWCKRFAANNKSKILSVTLEHLYTRLAVVVSRDAAYTSDAILTTFALKGNEVYKTATYKPFETVPYTYGTLTGLTPAVPSTTLNASTASATYDLLLIPATLTGDLTLTLTVDGKKMRVAIAKEKFASTKLEAGKQYNVNLKLKPGKLEVTSVTVENWDALAEVSGGNAEFDEIEGIDIGLYFVIAPGNLIVREGKYAFAEEQGYYSDIVSGGDYFCWNTSDPQEFSVFQPSWEDVRDPCRKIADGKWRTPTKPDCEALIDAGHVGGDDIYTMQDGTKKPGSYFGTTTVPSEANRDKYVFLPLAGFRDYYNSDPTTGAMFSGVEGYYWSSDAVDGITGHHLDFYGEYAFIGDLAPKGQGYSIRCVKDKPIEPIDIGLDFYIAPGNLIATKRTDDKLTYAFAEEQGYYSGVDDTYDPNGGDYFYWNTVDPWAVVDEELLSWDDANDPCRKVADGKWYTPTSAQCRALIDAGYVFGENIYTMSDLTTRTGCYYGTSTVPLPADQDKYVFLPAAGDRYEDGYFEHVDSWCSYWSSTSSGSGDATSVDVLFSGGFSGLSRNVMLYPVRCVRDK